MVFGSLLTDEAVLEEIGARLRRRRVDLDLTQAQLATRAGISKRTVERLEGGASVQSAHLVRVLRALELLGGLDALLPPVRARPMEHLRREGRPRRRASSVADPARRRKPWVWGDET